MLTSDEIWQNNEAYIKRLVAYKLASHPNEIEDTVQETGLAYFRAIQNGTVISDPKQWLTVVAGNKINDVYKKLAKEAALLQFWDEETLNAVPAQTEEPPLDEKTLLMCRNGFLSSLSKEDAILYHLRFEKDFKLKKIAKLMKISESNVKVRIFRLKQKAARYVNDWYEKTLGSKDERLY